MPCDLRLNTVKCSRKVWHVSKGPPTVQPWWVLLKTLFCFGGLSVVFTCLYCRWCMVGTFLREGWIFLSWSLVLWSPVPVCFHLLHLDGAEDKKKRSASTRAEQTPRGNRTGEGCKFTCLRKIRWSRLRLGLLGEWQISRFGEREPSGPKTFSSSKHPVSIIYRRREERVQVLLRKGGVLMEVPRFARQWERCLCWTRRRSLCPCSPEWPPSERETRRYPARRCSTHAWASRCKSMEVDTRFSFQIIYPQNSKKQKM